ncbi:MAG: lipoyl(octanoyl) transferase LipB [Candidatus Eisenbacteria bacterium]|nr:lipoyl(octanoyl) transferase LipB [Candidatus Eisenbacteria bacterium]
MNTLHVCALGPTRYRDGLALMDALVAARAAGETGDWLLYPDHESVLTVGRNPSDGNLIADPATLARAGIEVVEVPRGGDITWHGPGQLVGYPIVALDRVGRDLHRWLRTLEDAIMGALAQYDLHGVRIAGRTGVWLSEHEKIASIGVAVRRWVGYHGFALNVSNTLDPFAHIHPCGLHDIRMTSMADKLGASAPTLAEMRATVTAELVERLEFAAFHEHVPAEVWALAGIARTADTSKDVPTGVVPGLYGGV